MKKDKDVNLQVEQSIKNRQDNTLDVLRGVNDLLESKNAWTIGGNAFTLEGRECLPTDIEAVKFDLAGAIYLSARTLGLEDNEHRAYQFARSACCGDIELFNDSTSHAGILVTIADSIESAKDRNNWSI